MINGWITPRNPTFLVVMVYSTSINGDTPETGNFIINDITVTTKQYTVVQEVNTYIYMTDTMCHIKS